MQFGQNSLNYVIIYLIKNQNLLWFLLISIGVFFIGGAREAVAPLLVIIVLLQNEIKLHKCIFDISIMFWRI